ncbi:GTPase Era [candidate division KSB1 bacterium]|nr:GTPase Era [candidate division KSB1 bacterium]
MNQTDFKSGYVTVVGQPNVGKSTLVNNLMRFRLSVCTPKPQTTRHRILGIYSGDDFQMIFWDTPGLIEPKYRLHEAMMRAADRAIADADLILLIVDVDPLSFARNEAILSRLGTKNKPIVLAINKIDTVPSDALLPLIDLYRHLYEFVEIVPVSALHGTFVDELEKVLLRLLPFGPPLYPLDQITEHPEKFFVAEIIRGKIFEHFTQEIPYSTAVVIDDFVEREGKKDVIKARIVVERDTQKAMIIGKKGKALKQIGQEARKDIETFLGRPVFLELWVAVREKWRKKANFLREFGYDQ